MTVIKVIFFFLLFAGGIWAFAYLAAQENHLEDTAAYATTATIACTVGLLGLLYMYNRRDD